MQQAAKIIAPAALGLTLVPPVMFMFHSLAEVPMKALMGAGCVLWFVTARYWMKGGAE